MRVSVIIIFGALFLQPKAYCEQIVPLYGLFETSITGAKVYKNPFSEVELKAIFESPSGRRVEFFGFFDGNGKGGENGNIWKQRFMPDETGRWEYEIWFSDGSKRIKGGFLCTSEGSLPGPWRQKDNNPRWFSTARGENFLPSAFIAYANLADIDFSDAIEWAQNKGYNTLVTPTFNPKFWAKGWPNTTPFKSTLVSKLVNRWWRVVEYEKFNLKMWRQWDDLILKAGAAGIYIAPFEGPAGDYGGQSGLGTVVPPEGMEYYPKMNIRFDHPLNLLIIKYFVARQAAFWNLAYWNLYSTEIYEIKDKDEIVKYGEYMAAITPFGRMITAQDIEQNGRRWLTMMNFPKNRKLNTIQAKGVNRPTYQEAKACNQLAIESYHDMPVFATEALWEGQTRAKKPLRMIWGFLSGGIIPAWGDWSYEYGKDEHLYGSLGKSWAPVMPLDLRVFRPEQLGADTVGDEQLKIAIEAVQKVEFWKMNPHNDLVRNSEEAYCLADPGRQYIVYTPHGGDIQLDMNGWPGVFKYRWLDPVTGEFTEHMKVEGGHTVGFSAPINTDCVLFVIRVH